MRSGQMGKKSWRGCGTNHTHMYEASSPCRRVVRFTAAFGEEPAQEGGMSRRCFEPTAALRANRSDSSFGFCPGCRPVYFHVRKSMLKV